MEEFIAAKKLASDKLSAAQPEGEGKEDAKEGPSVVKETTEVEPLVFKYNTLHDLESLWWIAVFFIVCKEYDDDESEDSPEAATARAASQRKLASELFWDGSKRSLAIRDGYYFSRNVSRLVFPGDRIGLVLDEMRKMMFRAYTRAEEDINTVGFDVSGDLYDLYDRFLYGMSESLCKKDVIVRPLSRR